MVPLFIHTSLTERLIGLTARELQAVPDVLAVVYGTANAGAVQAAVRGGFVSSLITHTAIADEVAEPGIGDELTTTAIQSKFKACSATSKRRGSGATARLGLARPSRVCYAHPARCARRSSKPAGRTARLGKSRLLTLGERGRRHVAVRAAR